MRTILTLCMLAVVALFSATPVSADILALSQSGNNWTISITRPAGVDEIGAFDIKLGFNPAALHYDSTTYAPHLGTPSTDLFTCEGCVFDPYVVGNQVVDILEFSVLPVAVLQGLQPQTFDLATVHFTALTGGAPGVYIADSLVSDGYGNPVTEGVVPEPGSWVLLLTAAAGLGGAMRRRR